MYVGIYIPIVYGGDDEQDKVSDAHDEVNVGQAEVKVVGFQSNFADVKIDVEVKVVEGGNKDA